MKNDVWIQLENYGEKYEHLKCINSTEDQIREAENLLGLDFSKSFKIFLKHYQLSSLGCLNFYTLNPSIDSSTALWSLIEANKWFKEDEKWPGIDDWCIIANDGSGNPIGINPRGEIWISYHDANFEQEKLADDFEEFALKLINETLWD